jgi:hypothetical protein
MMISLKSHNMLDYLLALTLIMTPFLFGFSHVLAARNVCLLLGLALALSGLCTSYYFSLLKFIPLSTHMLLDMAIGVVLILGPFIFNYAPRLTPGQLTWHWIMGLGVWAVVGLTSTRSRSIQSRRQRRTLIDGTVQSK